MKYVFVSYSRKDLKLAQALARQLEETGVPTWVDTREIKGGEDWQRSLRDAVLGSGAVAVILTENANRSDWVTHECSIAMALGKPVIPIRFEPARLPAFLGNVQELVVPDGGADLSRVVRRLSNLCTGWKPVDEILTKVRTALVSLARDDWNQALDTLGELDHPDATSLLREALEHPALQVRHVVAIMLAQRTDLQAVPALFELYSQARTRADPSKITETRRALEVLAESRLAGMLALVQERLDAPDERIRGLGRDLLHLVADDRLLDDLIDRVGVDPADVDPRFVHALSTISDPRVVPAMLGLLGVAPDTKKAIKVRARAIKALSSRVNSAAVRDQVVTMLGHANPYCRSGAATVLSALDENRATSHVMRPLVALLSDTTVVEESNRSVPVWEMAQQALARSGRAAVDDLTKLIQSGPDDVAVRSADTLRTLLPQEAAAPLIDAVDSTSPEVGCAIVNVLGRLDVDAVIFQRLADSEHAELRAAAVEAIGRLKGEVADDVLRKALSDSNLTVRHSAARCLSDYGSPVRPSRLLEEPLEAALESDSPDLRRLAALALKRLGTVRGENLYVEWKKRQDGGR